MPSILYRITGILFILLGLSHWFVLAPQQDRNNKLTKELYDLQKKIDVYKSTL